MVAEAEDCTGIWGRELPLAAELFVVAAWAELAGIVSHSDPLRREAALPLLLLLLPRRVMSLSETRALTTTGTGLG